MAAKKKSAVEPSGTPNSGGATVKQYPANVRIPMAKVYVLSQMNGYKTIEGVPFFWPDPADIFRSVGKKSGGDNVVVTTIPKLMAVAASSDLYSRAIVIDPKGRPAVLKVTSLAEAKSPDDLLERQAFNQSVWDRYRAKINPSTAHISKAEWRKLAALTQASKVKG